MPKYFILIIFSLFLFSGCDQTIKPKSTTLEPKQPKKSVEIDIDTSFGKNVPDKKWEGYHKIGKLKIPTYITFSKDGTFKMYTQPIKTEGWQEVKNFKIEKIQIPSKDKNIDNIINYQNFLTTNILSDTLEPLCFILYAEGTPIKPDSPFSMHLCFSRAFKHMQIKMLKQTFELDRQ